MTINFTDFSLTEAITYDNFIKLLKDNKPAGIDTQRFLQWIAGNTRGLNVPDAEHPMYNNGIPVLDALVKSGDLVKSNFGSYRKSSPHLSKYIQRSLNDERLSLEQGEGATGTKKWTPNVSVPNRNSDEDRLAATQNRPGYKFGQERSGYATEIKEKILRNELEKEPQFIKNAINNIIPKFLNPDLEFRLLRRILKLRTSKKSYKDLIREIILAQDSVKTSIDNLIDLGLLSHDYDVNLKAVSDLKLALKYIFTEKPKSDNLTQLDKANVFASNLMAHATRIASDLGLKTNSVIRNVHPSSKTAAPDGLKAYHFLTRSNLTQKSVDNIKKYGIESEILKELPENVKKYINVILKYFPNVNNSDDIKNELEYKWNNLENFKSEENQNAKQNGRIESAIRTYAL